MVTDLRSWIWFLGTESKVLDSRLCVLSPDPHSQVLSSGSCVPGPGSWVPAHLAVIKKCDKKLLKSVTSITKCDKKLLQSASGITRCDNC